MADAPFVFVAGKGGTGKTTAAGAVALALADDGDAVHLISTDPAHSIGALFGQAAFGHVVASACSERLWLEELDADAAAERFLARAAAPVGEIVERGTYLDADDVAAFTRLALPGVDEMMALLRLVELADADRRVVVDTAPTGHTLRLLDAAATQEGLARALRAMAEKAAAVASGLARRPIRLASESIIDELDAGVASYRHRVLARAAFVLASRPDEVVLAETSRLAAALEARGLRIAARVETGGASATAGLPPPVDAPADAPVVTVPLLADPRGCDGLRAWFAAARLATPAGALPGQEVRSAARLARTGPDRIAPAGRSVGAAERRRGRVPAPAAAWLRRTPLQVLLFAGKGGVGKTTCAAATALLLSERRDVVLCSADPAGSLNDVLARDVTVQGRAGPRLRVVQIDAEAELRRWRQQYRDEVLAGLESIGLGGAAALDRRVIEALLELAPPGIDEFAALAAMLDAAGTDETVVLDTAPTGHFLRLLTMPALALDWTRQLMRIMLKYRAAGTAEATAGALLRTARELRALQGLLHDRSRAAVFIVTLDEPLVRAETEQLAEALRADGVPVAARIVNRTEGDAGPDAVPEADGTVLLAPAWPHPPVGATDLLEFAGTWMMLP